TYNLGYNNRNVVQRLIGNFNGDAFDDVVAFGYNHHDVALSNGLSFNANLWNESYEFSALNGWDDYDKNPKFVGDFNGDGMDDIIGFSDSQVLVGISTGSEFVFSEWTTMLTYNNGAYMQSEHPRMIGDFNGDGMDDIIGFDGNSVIVGISTGQGFIMDTWLLDHFTPTTGWDVDGRETGTVAIPNSYDKPDHISIGDVNGDGFDDLIGFKGNEVWISYSNGAQFLCPDFTSSQFPDVGKHTTRLVGNFDSTDDAEEVIALSKGYFQYIGFNWYFAGQSHYLNCNSCDAPVAGAELINSNGSHEETGIYTLNVHDYCSDAVAIDVSESSCYENYYFQIHEFDIATNTSISVVYNSGWITGDAPSNIDLSSYYNFPSNPNILYMVVFGVGFNEDAEYLLLRMNAQPPTGNETLTNSSSSRLMASKGSLMKPIHAYCLDKTSMAIDATASQCYDEYRFEMIEVSSTLIPIGLPLAQFPSSGVWNVGTLPNYVNLSTSSMVLGKFYRIQMFLKNSNGTTTTTWYVEFEDCISGPPKGKRIKGTETTGIRPQSKVYPNPTSDNYINIQLANYGENGAMALVYGTDGQLLFSTTVNSNEVSRLNIGDLSPGTYSVRLFSDSKTENLRFVKQ
ncbi:MAG: T9SS type A sorting domain-containing protein, partial [Crocinitomicaceae bacterium]|nr:T9SS type A sorting domain-containing protein [Crocinitomicaceae bacterium]